MLILRNLFAISVVALLPGVFSNCHDGWIRYGNSCYLIVRLKETWIEAEDHCKIFKGMLTEISDAQENAFLMNTLTNLGDSSCHWIGGTDLGLEGHWEWVVSGESFHYTDWHPGEPNNHNHEDCACMSSGYHWNDDSCTIKNPFICEIE